MAAAAAAAGDEAVREVMRAARKDARWVERRAAAALRRLDAAAGEEGLSDAAVEQLSSLHGAMRRVQRLLKQSLVGEAYDALRETLLDSPNEAAFWLRDARDADRVRSGKRPLAAAAEAAAAAADPGSASKRARPNEKEEKEAAPRKPLAHGDLELPVPPVEDVAPPERAADLGVELLVSVVTPVERESVMRHLRPPEGRARVLRTTPGHDAYLVGRLGAYTVAVVQQPQMGDSGASGAAQTVGDAVRYWRPWACVAVGIAFGLRPAKQEYGDVIVSHQLAAYDLERVTGDAEERVSRGAKTDASPTMRGAFSDMVTSDWSFAARGVDAPARPRHGLLLSGSKLVDSKPLALRLLGMYPEALGGDMEGFAVRAACDRERVPWLVVKAICDFGGLDGHKEKSAQPFAAAAAASLVRHVLSARRFDVLRPRA